MSETRSKAETQKRRTVCVDFDGVLHAYTTPWIDAHTIPDLPVPGAIEWLQRTISHFDIVIFSTRAKSKRGRDAMHDWIKGNAWEAYYAREGDSITLDEAGRVLNMNKIRFSYEKLPALIYIDDRAYRFDGTNWPSRNDIYSARPWNKPAPDSNTEPLETPDQSMTINDGLAQLGDSRIYSTRGDDRALAQTIREMRRFARRILKLQEVEIPETALIFAAEVAVNRLRELPGGHGYEVDLLADALRNVGGLPEGRNQDGEPI